LSSRPAAASVVAPTPASVITSYCLRAPAAFSLATISDVLPVRSATTRAPVCASKVWAMFFSTASPVSSDQVRMRIVLPAWRRSWARACRAGKA
jgi:hypothetical protein